ncbi:hypothetical protein A3I34_01885 [Candidatus Jorgensenbacteria bacterium RIFCSPLOWO2_02_FULL_45_12]|uniref:histidine--tRNA ligase n=2 Tax=Candidatus Joergenseniibacteriota TaxID=1752739 RepID=A0A1F6BMT9_9BACT|nr:MAG: Histidine-tRNA ligase [Candidatus Jorgensenbacteria bacterium GW2011_GWA2_45_9]OGG38231.1 MAG: hypothetical protein A3D55_01645 [Candidatus Jorgensenbacteria bacterium RIFCSPHIGHO2_02_FULL_45_20]OGG42248.1 MAG: hypothetical protein A3I34_01885 [Candidatus Jorgensenbacteria bacterium RIFCSPLOWO2_02_FULL_45_12]
MDKRKSEKKKDTQKSNSIRQEKNIHDFSVRGFADIIPKDSDIWREIIKTGSLVAELHGFHYMSTPAVESAAFFEKVFGSDKKLTGGRWYSVFGATARERLVLRPTGLFPMMRSYINHHLGYFSSPLKAFFYGKSFIREATDKLWPEGEFSEWGFAVMGDNDPIYDIEIIKSAAHFLKMLKIKKTVLKINATGCRACAGSYRDKIRTYWTREKQNLCKKCAVAQDFGRFLSCDEEGCRTRRESAPTILDYLCPNCNNHFKAVLELLEEDGLQYELDNYLILQENVWNRTVFSIFSQSGVCLALGGRFDYLSELVGGRSIPSVGCVVFTNRLAELLKSCPIETKEKPKVFFIAIGDHAKKASGRLLAMLRDNGVGAIEALGKKSLRVQLKAAERMKVPVSLLLGQKEAFEEMVIIRDMRTGAQETVTMKKMIETVKKKMKEI